MRYFGGKFRIAKPLTEYLKSVINVDDTFVDLFCGSCNVVSNINCNIRIANDKHYFLIEMFKDLQRGREYPDTITEEDYQNIKLNQLNDPALSGFVGFGCSFAGKWWGGYARGGLNRNYASNCNESLRQIFPKIKDVTFYNLDYKDFKIPTGSIVYCDIPYKNSTPYCKNEVGVFNHEEYYDWLKSQDCVIYTSEYKENVTEDFKIVWEYKSKQDIRGIDGSRKQTTEVLFINK